jgi:hypothetical protein
MGMNSRLSRFFSSIPSRVTPFTGFTARKCIALVTLICFVHSSILAPSVSAILEDRREAAAFNKAVDDFILPSTAGRITSANYQGGKQVIIAIQDLHCHPEVQKNIRKILTLLDNKYPLSRIYLEGASGKVDLSWLDAVEDKKLKAQVLESLVDQGKLTGVEYFAAESGRGDRVYGLENKEVHSANLLRLNRILEEQKQLQDLLAVLKQEMLPLKDRYYNSRNRSLEQIVLKHRKGGLDARKYYRLLSKYAKNLNIDIYGYKSITSFVELMEYEKALKYDRVADEMQQFMLVLKQKLPYSAYASLLKRTDNFTRLDELYVSLARLSRTYRFDLSYRFEHLNKFFAYLEASRRANPLNLIREENRLLYELNTRLCDSRSEREIVFLIDFFRYLEDYFTNAISADDYRYFTSHLVKGDKLE